MAYASITGRSGVEIIGHRGAPREHRENTAPSFSHAFTVGADAVELDVHATQDGTVVVHHDAVVTPRLGDSGPSAIIAESTLAHLRTIRIGGSTIPTLTEVLEMVPATATAYVEVKAAHIEDAVVDVIKSSGKRCAVHSFDHRIVRRVHELAPSIPVGILQTSYPVSPLLPLREAHARDLWQHWELIDQSLIDLVHADGARAIAWTVNDTDFAERLIAWGVDGICTDVPATMRALVDQPTR